MPEKIRFFEIFFRAGSAKVEDQSRTIYGSFERDFQLVYTYQIS